eukprot:gene18096-30590_t
MLIAAFATCWHLRHLHRFVNLQGVLGNGAMILTLLTKVLASSLSTGVVFADASLHAVHSATEVARLRARISHLEKQLQRGGGIPHPTPPTRARTLHLLRGGSTSPNSRVLSRVLHGASSALDLDAPPASRQGSGQRRVGQRALRVSTLR